MTFTPLPAALLTGGRRLADPQLSPDGRFATVLCRAGDRTELVLIDLSHGAEQQLPLEMGIAGSRGGSHRWLPNGSGIVYIGADGRLYVFDLDILRGRAITQTEAACSALAVSPDGTRAAYVVELEDIFVVATDGASEPVRLSRDADFVVDPCFSADSRFVAWHEWDVPNMAWDTSRIVVRDVDAKTEKRIAYAKDDVSVQQPRWSPDGRVLSFLSDESGFTNLWCVDADTLQNPRSLVAEQFDNGDLTWGPGQSTYAWVDADVVVTHRNEKGFGVFAERRVSDGAMLNQYSGTFANVHAASGVVIGLMSDFDKVAELVVIRDGETRSIARGAYVGVESTALRPEVVSWKSSDGTEIPGRLYRADSNDELPPMLVWIHGGPHGQSQATFLPRWQYFIDRGWSILVPDYRGTNGWGRAFLQGLRGGYGEVDVADVTAGIHAAIDNRWCDPSRVVAIGGSSAGLTLLMVLANEPSLCAAGVAMMPVTDLEATARDTWRFEAHYFDSLVGPLPDARETYVARSPITHANAITAPVLLLHGLDDESVPCAQSTEMAKAIVGAGGTVEVHLYEGEGHGWRKTETQIDELQRVEAFLCRYVLDVTKGESST
jgi:dipeptidyl aminopeptidase/acylaminoacyl peptidase